MQTRHGSIELPAPLVAEVRGEELEVRLPEGAERTFRLIAVPLLTKRTANEILDRAAQATTPVFVTYRQSSGDAREALRDAGVSFSGDDGRLFVRAPGILVERDQRRRTNRPQSGGLAEGEDQSIRNPFAKRSSRVPRWLLLHHEQTFSRAELAADVDLDPTSISRIVRALEDAAFVGTTRDIGAARQRRIRLTRPRALLEAWLPEWQRRRARRIRWDIGAKDAEEATALIADALADRAWAVGGIAGAAMVRPVVEPADVLLWVDAKDLSHLDAVLQPVPTRARTGTIRVAITPDPWTLGLAVEVGGIHVADKVQLWLDCASEGERALEAADAIAEAAGWS